MKIRDIYYLSILPLNAIVIVILSYLISKNTPEHELDSLTDDEYVDRGMEKLEELWLEPFKHILDILATICWIVLIKWIIW
jgi:hypothetical protein